MVMLSGFRRHPSAADGTLMLPQESRALPSRFSADGLLLTFSYCIIASSEQLEISTVHWVLFKFCKSLKATRVALDLIHNFSPLRIVAAQIGDAEFQPAVLFVGR